MNNDQVQIRIDKHFKKDEFNKTLFYPESGFGLGYILDSDERENKIRNLLNKTYNPALKYLELVIVLFISFIFMQINPDYFNEFFIIPCVIICNIRKEYYEIKIKTLIKNLPLAQKMDYYLPKFLFYISCGILLILLLFTFDPTSKRHWKTAFFIKYGFILYVVVYLIYPIMKSLYFRLIHMGIPEGD